MKLKSILLAAVSVFALASCTKEYKPVIDPSPNSFRGYFKADLSDSTQYIADQQFAKKTWIEAANVTQLAIGSTQFSYNMDTSSYITMSLSIGNYQGVKRYPIELSNSAAYFIKYNAEDSKLYTAKPYEENSFIDILSDDGGKLTGAFTFIGIYNKSNQIEEIAVSNGTFEVYE